MKRIVAVSSVGLKRARSVNMKLAPMMALLGPNGSGKSSVLAAVTYALGGRIAGVKAADVPLLLPEKTFSASVDVEGPGEKLSFVRGRKPKAYAAASRWDDTNKKSEEAEGNAAVETFLEKHMGEHAELFIDAFDPEKNLWSMSPEKRVRWTFSVVTKKCGLDKAEMTERVAAIYGGSLPLVEHKRLDAVEIVDESLVHAEEWLKSTKKSVGEYEVVLGSLTDAISEPKAEELESAKREKTEAAKAFQDVCEEQGAAARKKALREELDRKKAELEKAKAARERFLPLESEYKRLDAEYVALLEQGKQSMRDHQAAQERVLELDELLRLLSGRVCPTCQADLEDDRAKATVRRYEAEREAVARRAAELLEPDATDDIGELGKRISPLVLAMAECRRDGAERIDQLAGEVLNRTAELENYAAGVAEEPVEKRIAKAKSQMDEADAKLSELTNRQQLAKERAKKAEAYDKSKAAFAMYKGRVEALKALREELLERSRDALRTCLTAAEHALAPPWASGFGLDIAETGLELSHVLKSGRCVPFAAMSTGEKIVGSTVLLVALRRLFGDVPWSAVLVDNLESTSLKEREALVRYLMIESANVSNILLLSSDDRGFEGVVTKRFE